MRRRRQTKGVEVRERRWKVVVLLATGIVIGVVMAGSPAGAHVGGTVNHLWSHLKPKADARYERPVIQPGQTVRGTIGFRAEASGGGVEFGANASLPRAAPVGIDDAHVEVLGTDGSATECPGSYFNPTASPGYVCIYPHTLTFATVNGGHMWGVSDNGKWGFQVSWNSTMAGPTAFFGTWAYKAPTG
jgi:hypothetical protein